MSNAVKLPNYICHKRVSAAKITEIETPVEREPFCILKFGEIGGFKEIDEKWFDRFQPKVGGYYVVYEDGYSSFSPAKAFEEGYIKA